MFKKKSNIGKIIYNHLINNKMEYFIVTLLFFIGIFISIFYINNLEDVKLGEVNTYLKNLFTNISSYEGIDLLSLLKTSILYNIIIIVIIWFGAATIIGIPIVYGTIILKGFSIGCTISCIVNSFGFLKGIIFAVILLFLHNIILLPSIMATSVSGVKLYKSIVKNKNRENIKLEILRHTIFSIIMLVLSIFASIVETYISTNLFIIILKNIKF